MLLSIIIVSYNTKKLTLQTLESLFQDLKNSQLVEKSEVIIIDNNSTDGSVGAIKKYLTHNSLKHKIIANNDNKGFGAANNQGIQVSQGQYIFLLNSDTIVKKGALTNLLKVIKTPVNSQTAFLKNQNKILDNIAVIAPQLLNPDNTQQPQGGDLPNLFSLTCHILMLDNLPFIGKLLPSTQHTGANSRKNTHQKVVRKGWIAATAMMVKKKVFNDIGLFDNNIFMYGEDMEFCLRAKKHHYDIGLVTNARVVHYGSASSSKAKSLKSELESYIYLWSKHFPHWQLKLVETIIKIGALLRMILFGKILRQKKRAQIYQNYLTKS